MFIQGNKLGLLMLVICALVAGAGYFLLKLPNPVTMMGVGSAFTLMDIIVRLRSRTLPGWLLSKELGGYLYFIPAWLGGLIVIAINLVSGLQPS